ncbi:MAG: sensor histidine kinase [Alphaproteobacteria bacterium]|nr:sensor histidine kinase [Alphaproteobacteria bacterium]
MQHRSRNLLAVVGGVAEQTQMSSRSLEEFGESFEQRLAALGRAHGLLSRDAEPTVAMAQIVELELTAPGIDTGDNRVGLSGPEIMLPAKTVPLVALALHELLTNAIKHGGLRAVSSGRLEITWDEQSDGNGHRRQRLDWAETGAPPVGNPDAAPRGFGRELIEVLLPYELDAETQLVFTGDGLRCSIVLPAGGA